MDLVYHSGEHTAGLHGHTIQLIDVATGWSERAALLGRSQKDMEGDFECILARLPPVKELHLDNGSEFFNHHLVWYWKDKVSGVHLSRSRPFQKNEHSMVEQKNDTLVRKSLGNLRLDTPEQIAALNVLYEQMWLYYNLFQPVLHLAEKTWIGDKVLCKWDTAKTFYERLVLSGVLSQEQQAGLQQLYEQTNLPPLREAIYRQLDLLWQSATQPRGKPTSRKEEVGFSNIFI